MAGIIELLISDMTMSFMWVWSSVLIKIFVHDVLGYHHYDLHAEIIRYSLSIMNMFLFAYLAKVTKGGAYNPLTVLSSAISGSFGKFLFTIGSRIPLQVFGSIMGVRLILLTFPGIGRGPRLTVSLHQGALTEGLLTFTIVLISHALSTKIPGSFFRKTWISSVSKLALHILGSDLTGGCMNPASVMGWAYARGDHITEEHLLVYWLAPVIGTLLAAWTFRYLVRPSKQEKEKKTD
ncbi:small and basic intrinsic protein 2,1 [Artemisia annua]|uniref:Small and basic intrinsic protein 2,1 n=1 Tax=Artemisia annua TaxID=35608 RepID=A0A2U1M2U5_ARTAN|nr:small and basic intrinsic protein 2,1 [Artemisia annua]